MADERLGRVATSASVRLTSLRSCFVALPERWAHALLPLLKKPGHLVSYELRHADGRRIHVSWAGDVTNSLAFRSPSGTDGGGLFPSPFATTAKSGQQQETVIELDRTFAHYVGIEDGDKVQVIPEDVRLHPTAVTVEPSTEDDWEIIETNAGHVEASLLAQIRVFTVGMTIPIWIRTQHVRVHVVSVEGVDGLSNNNALRFDEGCEVRVAPKVRRRPTDDSAARATPHDLQQAAAAAAQLTAGDCIRRVIPAERLMHLPYACIPESCNGGVQSATATSERESAGGDRVTKAQIDAHVPLLWPAGLCALLSPRDILLASATPDSVAFVEVLSPATHANGPLKAIFACQSRDDVPEGHIALPDAARLHLGHVRLSCCSVREVPLASDVCIGGKVTKLRATVIRFKERGPVNAAEWNERVADAVLRTLVDVHASVGVFPMRDGVLLRVAVGSNRADHVTVALHRAVEGPQQLPKVANDVAALGGGSIWCIDAANPSLLSVDVMMTDGADSVRLVELSIDPHIAPPMNDVSDGGALHEFHLPGMSRAVSMCTDILSAAFTPTVRRALRCPHPSGLLVHGSSGSGRSRLLATLSHMAEAGALTWGGRGGAPVRAVHVACGALSGDLRKAPVAALASALSMAYSCRPSVLVLDDFDALLQNSMDGELDSSSLSVLRALADWMDSACEGVDASGSCIVGACLDGSPCAVVASCRDGGAVLGMTNSFGLFDNAVELRNPGVQERRDIVSHLLSCNGLIDNKDPGSNAESAPVVSEDSDITLLDEIASTTDGYTVADLSNLCERVSHAVAVRAAMSGASPLVGDVHATRDDLARARKGFMPSSLRGLRGSKKGDGGGEKSVTWADVGGLAGAKSLLRETIEWPAKYARLFSQCPLRHRSGVLLYGPPGCGKTLIASAVAAECGLGYVAVNGPELLGKYIGSSEAAVRDLFSRARAAKPCVLFFDEFDAIAPVRGSDTAGVADRVVNQLLTELDGVESSGGVYVLAASSRPDMIDPALLRPGRMDRCVLIGRPTFSERVDILRSVSRHMDVDSEIDFESIAENCEWFTGADLQGLVSTAHVAAVRQTLLGESSGGDWSAVLAGSGSDGVGQAVTGAGGHVGSLAAATDGHIVGDGDMTASERAAMNERVGRVVEGASAAARNRNGASGSGLGVRQRIVLTQRHFVDALGDTRPSTSLAEWRRLDALYNEFANARSGGGSANATPPQHPKRVTLA